MVALSQLTSKSTVALCAACLLFSGCANSATDVSLEPAALLQKINEKGPKPVLEELRGEKWRTVLKNIETGKKPWLEVATALHRATDGGFSTMLSLAAGVALAHSPQDVLLVTGAELSIEGVCGYPDMADARTNTQQKVVAYLDTRISAVNKLVGSEVVSLRNQCLQTLENTKREVMSPSGPFSQKTK